MGKKKAAKRKQIEPAEEVDTHSEGSAEEQSDVESNEDTESQSVQTQEKRQRTKVDWDDTYALVKLMLVEGKNWEKLLSQLKNEQHRFTEFDTNKLRRHFNSLKGPKSKLTTLKNGAYKMAAFRPKKRKEDIATYRKLEQEHAEAEVILKEQREEVVEWMTKIEEREHSLSSKEASESAQAKEADYRKKATDNQANRKAVIQERFDLWKDRDQQERDHRDKQIKLNTQLAEALTKKHGH